MPPTLRAIFLDAAGTLFHLREPVGDAYARIAAEHGVSAQPATLEKAFRAAWKALPSPLHAEGALPSDDDRSWWRALVAKTFEAAVPEQEQARGDLGSDDTFEQMFTAMYDHFANADAWQLYGDTLPALKRLRAHGELKLFVLSNFDRRLHAILSGLGIAHFFDGVIVSSEVGASKPHARMFQTAILTAGMAAWHCLHVGDDARCDLEGAKAAGMQAVLVDRPAVTLLTIAEKV
ncbi:MAG: HAD-IA family hydrolase [Roseimicrobium sp.]